MAKANLTEAFAEKVKPADTRIDYWDEKMSGFGLRVTEKGVKTWCVLYRFDGVQKRFTIGTHPAIKAQRAREAAQDALHKAQLGKADAAAEKKAARGAGTFGELADQYLAHGEKTKRTWEVDKAMINRDLVGWLNRPLKGIHRSDVREVMATIEKRGSLTMANRVLALISAMFNFAIARSDDEIMNPAYKFPKPGSETKRDRILTDDEIKRLWKLLEDKPKKVAAYVKLCLLTGQRAREVLQMAVAEVDFETGIWTIPSARAKNDRLHAVPLSPTAMTLIEGIKNGTPYLFPMQQLKPRPMNTFRVWIDELREELKFETDWTCHDLRRTAASGMSRLGLGRFVIERVLNHSDSGVGGIYDRYDYEREKRDALTKWDAKIAEIVAV